RTAIREDREARLVLEETVVADIGRATGDLALRRVEQEGRDHELALLEVLDRPEVDLVVVLVLEDRRDREADDGHGEDPGNDGAESERRALEEHVAVDALGLRWSRRRLAFARRDRGSARRRGWELTPPVVAGDVADPEEAKNDCQGRADRHGGPADDQPDENADDADREADRP